MLRAEQCARLLLRQAAQQAPTQAASSVLVGTPAAAWQASSAWPWLPPANQAALFSSSAAREASANGAGLLAPLSPSCQQQRQRVAVGISGGVDSAVAAMLLKQQGHEVIGVFMRNWDEGEETGNQNCSVERDLRDAAAVCRQLSIPLHEADFVSKYWNQVFSEFLSQCSRGLTPNPDLACNRHIKFDALLSFAEHLGATAVATGHYARLRWPSNSAAILNAPPSGSSTGSHDAAAAWGRQAEGERAEPAGPQLLRGLDHRKDQTYFLASVQPEALRRVMFPVGQLHKAEVRRMAAQAGLVPASKRSSAGICFIGRRDFGGFLNQYTPPLPGRFLDVDSGADLGPCANLLAVTHGQRPRLSGLPDRTYIVGKDVVGRVAYVVGGSQHPALLCRTALLRTPHWLSSAHAHQLAQQGWLRCQYKARYGQEPRECLVFPAGLPLSSGAAAAAQSTAAAAAAAGSHGSGPAGGPAAALEPLLAGEFRPSAYCRLQPEDSRLLPGYLVALFAEPALAITPQQACVLYDGELCLGSALIAMPGPSLHEEASALAPPAVAAAAAAKPPLHACG